MVAPPGQSYEATFCLASYPLASPSGMPPTMIAFNLPSLTIALGLSHVLPTLVPSVKYTCGMLLEP